MINQKSGRIKNTPICTGPKRIRSKESNRELSNYHRQHQKRRIHLWPPNTYHTRQGNQKKSIAPHDHPNDSLAPSHGQTPPQCEASHGILFIGGGPLLHTKSMKVYFRSVQAFNSRGKSETISGLNQVNTKYKDRGFTITDFHG